MAKSLESWEGLEGKVVMVTGASSGIGRDFCINLAKAGCKVLAAARRVDRLQSLCHELNQLSGSASGLASTKYPRAVAVELDLTADGPTIEKSVQKAWDVFGHIHALINNAGFRGFILLYPHFSFYFVFFKLQSFSQIWVFCFRNYNRNVSSIVLVKEKSSGTVILKNNKVNK